LQGPPSRPRFAAGYETQEIQVLRNARATLAENWS